jgi:hypothetical protein
MFARNTRKASLEHQDADAGTVNRLSAMGLVAIPINHPSPLPLLPIFAATVAMILRAAGSVYGRNLAAFTPRDRMLLA